MLNGLALLILGGYGSAVVWNGNLEKLLELLKGEAGFIEWGIAIALLGVIYNNQSVHPIGKALIGVTFFGIAMKVVTNPNFHKLIESVKEGDGNITDRLRAAFPAPDTETSPNHRAR